MVEQPWVQSLVPLYPHRKEYGFKIMITILSLPDYIQAKINLGIHEFYHILILFFPTLLHWEARIIPRMKR